MPPTRVTVALNAKQSQKAPLLIPAEVASIRDLVCKAVQVKLRLKAPTRFFVRRTGQELVSEEDWRDNLKDDVVFLASAGEDYVGSRRETHGMYISSDTSTFALNDPICSQPL